MADLRCPKGSKGGFFSDNLLKCHTGAECLINLQQNTCNSRIVGLEDNVLVI